MPLHMKTKFVDELVRLRWAEYMAGGTSLQAFSLSGEPLMTISVWAERPRPKDEIVVRTWGGNEGALEWLVATGIVVDTGERVQCGFTEGVVVKILKQPQA